MPKDYAKALRSKPRKRTTRRTGSTRKTKPLRPLFHGPSFSGGILLGAALVIFLSYAPEIFEAQLNTDSDSLIPTVAKAEVPLTFEFDDILRNSSVEVDPDIYGSDGGDADSAESQNTEYMLQAASFRNMKDADALRATLLLRDLPVQTERVSLSDGPWYRVTVGPFNSATHAQRAMTLLREQNVSPFWIKRDNAQQALN